MSCRKTLLVALLLTLFAVPGAFAQGFGQGFGQHEFEITPFGGYKFGGNISLPPGTASPYDYLPIRSSVDYGIFASYSIWPNFQAEFQFNHQPTSIYGHEIATGTQVYQTSADLNMYQFGFAYNFKPSDSKLKPFIGAGLGFTNWKPYAQLPVSSNTFSYNIGGGVKYFLTDHIGVRVDVRWSPSRTTTSEQEFCDYYFGYCGTEPVSSHAQQGQVNVGLIFRFHSQYGS